MAKEGLKYFLFSLGISIVFFFFGWWILASILSVWTAYVAFFFRNPKRSFEENLKVILSPADGKIIYLAEDFEKEFLNEQRIKISVFMSLFDVHVNRAPISGVIKGMKYFKGEFKSAWGEGVSNHNERNFLLIENSVLKLVVTQVAGLCARRIVCDVGEGSSVQQGARYGIIQFGSRCDLFVPKSALIAVKLGDKVKAGETVLATLP